MTQTIASIPAAQTWRRDAPGTLTGPGGWTVVNTNSGGYPWIVVRPDDSPVGPGAGTGYMSAESAQWAAVQIHGARDAFTAPVLPAGAIVHIQIPQGDAYIGEVVSTAGNLITLRNYSTWFEGTTEPFSSPYFDDEVRVAIDHDTFVDVQS
jgi:hypothetical protein